MPGDASVGDALDKQEGSLHRKRTRYDVYFGRDVAGYEGPGRLFNWDWDRAAHTFWAVALGWELIISRVSESVGG